MRTSTLQVSYLLDLKSKLFNCKYHVLFAWAVMQGVKAKKEQNLFQYLIVLNNSIGVD